MTKINEDDVIKIIENAFERPEVRITRDSSAANNGGWDSLTQINIILALDEAFEGKVGEIQEMAAADSVEKILQILKTRQLI